MKDAKTSNVITALTNIFTLFGPPLSIHSDRGAQFESHEFNLFLGRWNVRKSRTTPYNPAGNGQCERTNGTIWRTVKLRLKQLNKSLDQWEEELNMALMNIRTLACRTINNESPHNRLFAFTRRTALKNGDLQDHYLADVPEWMNPASPVYVKNFVRNRKDNPLVKEARMVKVISPQHALVSYPQTNRVDTVAKKYIAKSVDQPVTSHEPQADVPLNDEYGEGTSELPLVDPGHISDTNTVEHDQHAASPPSFVQETNDSKQSATTGCAL